MASVLKKLQKVTFTFTFNPITGLDRPRGFQETEAPRFHDNWHVKVPYTPPAFTPRKYSWYSFLLEAESTPEP